MSNNRPKNTDQQHTAVVSTATEQASISEVFLPSEPDRRELLLSATALAIGLYLPWSPAPPALADAGIGAEAFRDLTVALTGFAPRNRFLAEDFLAAFRADAADLAKLHAIVRDNAAGTWEMHIEAAGLSELAERLITAWYTGMTGDGADREVVTYLNAFVWFACGYTKPPSQCDWTFGAWADPPPPGRFPA